MSILLTTRPFEALTVRQLHDLLQLRIDVFVVEQRCAYAEADGRDPEALHVLAHDEQGRLVGCARLLPPDADGLPRVGRVVVRADHRGQGLAHRIMEEALQALRAAYGSRRSKLAAQAPLQGFYERHGFAAAGPEYLWDGIPHVDMVRQAD